ncbi:hypothetical protein LXT21_07765 [Myxococcus sp. K38C18041901]|uniref:hypothetical protein n=1 Tax=Myxococcus guangdongensis TaxID=2906760 RepID=UPI0020A7D2F9|nr:hypothetical protein [Myxococcus guangdongensis]MCP3058664.1 hypothetical protein [Myxococcus guangdongensis]
MPSAQSPYLTLALAGLLIGAIYYLEAWYKRRRRQAWRIFATRQGWTSSQSDEALEVQGFYRGRPFSLRTEATTLSQGDPAITVLRMELSDAAPPELLLETKSLRDTFRMRFSPVGEKVGDVELDTLLNLHNLSPRTRELLLTPSLREPLMHAYRYYWRLSIFAGTMEAERQGVPTSPEKLEALIAPALALADALHLSTGQALPPHSRRRAQS